MGRAGNIWTFQEAERDPKKLIEAAVKAADEGETPPPELRLAWWCEQWNALPENGGLYQQDHKTIRRMTALTNIYNLVTRVRNMKGAQIHNLTTSERRILRALRDEGLL